MWYFSLSGRMKYLVKKWQRATRVGSSAVTGSTATHNGEHPIVSPQSRGAYKEL